MKIKRMETSGPAHVTGSGADTEGAPPDCAACGACCREAFDTSPVEDTDVRTLRNLPHLVRVSADGWRDLRRVPSPTGCGTRCAALTGGPPYRCSVYEDRPAACSELEPGSEACRFARARVGLG
jgi:Fe-S-cluster containining protein